VEAGEAGATLVVCAGDEAALDAVLAALPPPPPLDDYSRAHSPSEDAFVEGQHCGRCSPQCTGSELAMREGLGGGRSMQPLPIAVARCQFHFQTVRTCVACVPASSD
jgi:hypothetical protein